MALRKSTGLRNALAADYGIRDALANTRLRIYSGTQPADADAAATGTLLGTFTLSGGAYTSPVKSYAEIQITGGGGGTIDTVTVGGAIPLIGSAVSWDADVGTTALALSTAINAYQNGLGITAEVSTDTVTISCPFWLGANANSLTLSNTTTTVTITDDAAFGDGVSAVNGLNWQFPAASGVLSKETTVWQMTAGATGTAGYFRFEQDPDDTQGVSTEFVRLDGAIATTGSDLNLTSTSIVSAGVYTINSWTMTVPEEGC